jgi:predicted amidohydrolase
MSILVACIQPPYLVAERRLLTAEEIIDAGLSLLARAGQRGADIACLPEYLNAMNCDHEELRARAEPVPGPLTRRVAAIAREYEMTVVLALVERRGDALHNSAVLIDSAGTVLGVAEKTHLTRVEREDIGLTAGSDYPVLDLPWGKAGIMVCYDGHFPEVARILAVRGADIIFFPSLQRRLGERKCAIQVAARAMDNAVYVARSSYGVAPDVAWTPDMMYGLSCIVGPHGDTLANCGRYAGVCYAEIDFSQPILQERSAGDEVGDLRRFLREDRRPDTYGELMERGRPRPQRWQ